MTTPYDAALRLRQREMDDMRVSISVEVNQLIVIERRRDAIDDSVRTEVQLATADHGFSAHAFVARMRAQRDALSRDRAAVDARLNSLQLQAAEAYGSLRAIEGAAGRYRDEATRVAATAEQSQIDDFSAARFTRALRDARRIRDSKRADLA
ncbi:hypothetical protein BH10PSE14_BH10PSE14_13670 [soil metagenome]